MDNIMARTVCVLSFLLTHFCDGAPGSATAFLRAEATAETLRHNLESTALAQAHAAQAHKLYVLSHRFRFVWAAFDKLDAEFKALHARVRNHTVRDADFRGTLGALIHRRQRLRRTLRAVQAELRGEGGGGSGVGDGGGGGGTSDRGGGSLSAAAFGRTEGAPQRLVDGAQRLEAATVGTHSARKMEQLVALGRGRAVMYSIHITHHAGTALCMAARLNTKVPPFVCNMDKPLLPAQFMPWARQHGYGFVTSEFQGTVRAGWNWTSVAWERPDLVSVVVVRDPMDRLFSEDGSAISEFGETRDRDWRAWERYAHSRYTDNFALRVFGYVPLDRKVTRRDLEVAKAWLQRATVIIDQACFSSTVRELFGQIGWHKLKGPDFQLKRSSRIKHHASAHENSNRALIGNETIYRELESRNVLDIELYRWAKKRAWKVCNDE